MKIYALVLLKPDAVKRKLPDGAPKPGAFKLPEAAAAPAAE